MTELKGTQELKELLDLVLSGVEVAVKAGADGKVDLNDAPLLLGVLPKLGPALDKVGEVPAELSDLSEAEALDLVAYVGGKLALPDGKAKDVINASLKAVVAVHALVKALKE